MNLQSRNVHLNHGKAQILHGVDLTARAGQLTAIIGPNGAGKTSLMRVLTGELRADQGSVWLNGGDVGKMHPRELASQRAVLPQHNTLSFPFTVAEIIRIGLNVYTGIDDAGMIQASLRRVGLPEYSGRFYQELSGGEQQRVQLARALAQVWQPVAAGKPCWLFLDEPVNNLDIAHQLTIMRLAADYARNGGGVIAIMHDLNLTAMFADHVLLMKNGHAMQEGPCETILTDQLLSDAYGCELRVNYQPASGIWVLPQGVA